MPVTPIYELEVPAPYDTFFLHGEKALSVAPTIDGAAPRTTYHLAFYAFLEGGEYLLRLMAENTSSWSTSVTYQNARVFLYTKRGLGPGEHIIHMPRGFQRIDLIVSNLLTTPGPAYVAFSLHRQGKLVYSSSGFGWVFNTAGIADNEIPGWDSDVRLSLPVFTLLPNWREGVLERLTYVTEILTSESDDEQRRSLRFSPRRSFEVSFLRSEERRTRIDSYLAGVGKHEVMLPMWHEQFPLTATLTGTLTFPDATLQYREFRVGMLCMVNDKDPDVYEVLKIATINLATDTIEFATAPTGTWPAGSRIFPLRVARVREPSTISNLTDRVGTAQVRFELHDTETLWYDPQTSTVPVFTFNPNRDEAISMSYDRTTAHEIDNLYGPMDLYDAAQRGVVMVRGMLQFRGRQALMAWRKFIDMTRGRARRFWSPTFMDDLKPVGTLSGVNLEIKSIGFTEYFRTTQEMRGSLVVELYDGDPLYREITDAERIDEHTEQLTLNESLSVPISSVKRISYLQVTRFDQDTFEIKHLVDQSAAVSSAFVLRTTARNGLGLPGPDVVGIYTLLVHFDGPNGSTTFTDSSGNNIPLYSRNGANVTNTDTMAGGAGAFDGGDPFDGNAARVESDPTPLLRITGDYTIGGWLKVFKDGAAFRGGLILNITSSLSQELDLTCDGFGFLGGEAGPASFPIVEDTWYHVAICRVGTVARLFINGEIASVSPSNEFEHAGDASIHFGGTLDYVHFAGKLDEWYVINGVGLYTEPFTPPTPPLS